MELGSCTTLITLLLGPAKEISHIHQIFDCRNISFTFGPFFFISLEVSFVNQNKNSMAGGVILGCIYHPLFHIHAGSYAAFVHNTTLRLLYVHRYVKRWMGLPWSLFLFFLSCFTKQQRRLDRSAGGWDGVQHGVPMAMTCLVHIGTYLGTSCNVRVYIFT